MLSSFVGAVMILSLTPGPDMALLISRGVGQGWKAAWCTAFGFTLAGFIQIPLLALGIASLFQSSPLAFDVLRYLGAAYLMWRGIQLILKAVPPSQFPGISSATTLTKAISDGVIASLTNPKGLIFLLAFLPQFVDPSTGSVTIQLVLLGLLMKVVALIIETAIAIGAGCLGQFMRRSPSFVMWQERVTGALLIGLALRLVTMNDREWISFCRNSS
ncbi:MAG: LysE family translocator [Actinobacteria bacterium]|nr:LysE family translocator [Actinomycetota bacterium]